MSEIIKPKIEMRRFALIWRLMLVAIMCGSWCASALAMKCYQDWDLLLIDSSAGVQVWLSDDSASSDTADSAEGGAGVVWLVEGYLRFYQGTDEWKLGVIHEPSSILVISRAGG